VNPLLERLEMAGEQAWVAGTVHEGDGRVVLNG
jgi:hypothetical protein